MVLFCSQVKHDEGADIFDEAESMDVSDDEQKDKEHKQARLRRQPKDMEFV